MLSVVSTFVIMRSAKLIVVTFNNIMLNVAMVSVIMQMPLFLVPMKKKEASHLFRNLLFPFDLLDVLQCLLHQRLVPLRPLLQLLLLRLGHLGALESSL
jgi:hypothetical protein